MSKWIAAAQPTTPPAYTLGFLFHVDNKLGECDLCMVYFNPFNLEKNEFLTHLSGSARFYLNIRTAMIN